MIDDVNIREYPIDHLRRQIGVIEQDVFLFSASIKENILYAGFDTQYDMFYYETGIFGYCGDFRDFILSDCIQSLLDGAHQRGIKVLLGVNRHFMAGVYVDRPATCAEFESFISAYKTHPALLGWMMGDHSLRLNRSPGSSIMLT